MFSLKTLYCRGSGLELLAAFLCLAVCHDSSLKRPQTFPLPVTFALSKSIA